MRLVSMRDETATIRHAASTALGTCVKKGVRNMRVSTTETAVTMPASWLLPPVEATTAVREKEPAQV